MASLTDLAWISASSNKNEKAEALFKFIQIAFQDQKLKGSPLSHLQAKWGESVQKLFQDALPDDIYAPGGAGKTTTVKFFIKKLQDQYPDKRVLFLSPIAFAQGELGDSDKIQGAMLDQRSGRALYELPKGWDPDNVIVVVDEAHLLAPDCQLVLKGKNKEKEVGGQFLRMTATPITSGLDVSGSLQVVSNHLNERLQEIREAQRSLVTQLERVEIENREKRDVAVLESLHKAIVAAYGAKNGGERNYNREAFALIGQLLGPTLEILEVVRDQRGRKQSQWASELQAICSSSTFDNDTKFKRLAVHLASAGRLSQSSSNDTVRNYFDNLAFQESMKKCLLGSSLPAIQGKALNWVSFITAAFGGTRAENLQQMGAEYKFPGFQGAAKTEEDPRERLLNEELEALSSVEKTLKARLESVERLRFQDANSDRRALFERTAHLRQELLGSITSSLSGSPQATVPGYEVTLSADQAAAAVVSSVRAPTPMQVHNVDDGDDALEILDFSKVEDRALAANQAFLAVEKRMSELDQPCTRAQVIFPGVKLSVEHIRAFDWNGMTIPSQKGSSKLPVHVVFHNSDKESPDYGKDMMLSPGGSLSVLDPSFDRSGKFIIMLYDDTNKQGGDFGHLSEVKPAAGGIVSDDIAQFVFLNVHDNQHALPETTASESDAYQIMCRKRGERSGLAPFVFSTRPQAQLRQLFHSQQVRTENGWAKRDLVEAVKERLLRAKRIAEALVDSNKLAGLDVSPLDLRILDQGGDSPSDLQAAAKRVDSFCQTLLAQFAPSEEPAAAMPQTSPGGAGAGAAAARAAIGAVVRTGPSAAVQGALAATAGLRIATGRTILSAGAGQPSASQGMRQTLLGQVTWVDSSRQADRAETVYSSLLEVANAVSQANQLLERNRALLEHAQA